MPAVSIACRRPPIFTWVAVSGTCLTVTRIFMRRRSSEWCLGLGIVVELAGDPEAVTRDEDAIEDDGLAGGVERHALGLEGRHAGRAAELARLARPQAHRRHRLAARGSTTMPSLNSSTWRSGVTREIGGERLPRRCRAGRNERCRLIGRPVDQPQPLERHHAGAAAAAPSARGHAAVGGRRTRAPAPAWSTCLALRREVAGEALELQDLVVDGAARPRTCRARAAG